MDNINIIHNMRSIRVNREKLLSTLKENFENHKKEYNKALTTWAIAQMQVLEESIQQFKNNNHLDLLDYSIEILKKPFYHGKEYETAINMLEWSIDENVLLEQDQFQQFVMDQWSWQHTFRAANDYNTSKLKYDEI